MTRATIRPRTFRAHEATLVLGSSGNVTTCDICGKDKVSTFRRGQQRVCLGCLKWMVCGRKRQ